LESRHFKIGEDKELGDVIFVGGKNLLRFLTHERLKGYIHTSKQTMRCASLILCFNNIMVMFFSQTGVKISSDLDTDTEVDAGIFGSSKRPEDDFDFYD